MGKTIQWGYAVVSEGAMQNIVVMIPKPIEWGLPHDSCVLSVRLFNIDIHDAVYGVLKDLCMDRSYVFEDLLEVAMDCMDPNDPISFNQEYTAAYTFIQQLLSKTIVFLNPYLINIQQYGKPISIESFVISGTDTYIVTILVDSACKQNMFF